MYFEYTLKIKCHQVFTIDVGMVHYAKAVTSSKVFPAVWLHSPWYSLGKT